MGWMQAIAAASGLLHLLGGVFVLAVLRREQNPGFFVAPLALNGIWAGLLLAQEFFYADIATLTWLLACADIVAALAMAAWNLLLLRLFADSTGGKLFDNGLARGMGLAIAAALLAAAWAALAAPIQGLAAGRETLILLFVANLTLSVAGLILVENLWRNHETDTLWLIKFMLIGLAVLFGFDFMISADALLWQQLDSTIMAARSVLHLLALPLVLISVKRLRRARRGMLLSRRFAYHSASIVAAGAYLLVIGLAGYYIRFFGGSLGNVLQVGFLGLATIALAAMLASGSLRGRVRNFISGNLFDLKYDYREEWLRFIETLAADSGAPDIRERLLRAIANLMDSPGAGLWQWNDASQTYTNSLDWNFGTAGEGVPLDSRLVAQLLSDKGIVVVAEERARSDGSVLPAWLAAEERAWLIVPLVHRDQLLGFIVLRHSRAPREVDWEDFGLLRTVGRQAASYLAEHNASRVLAESHDLQLFNKRFAFVIHDIKTVIYQMSLLLSNADRHASNPEFQKDLLLSVRESVDSMKRILTQINSERMKDRAAARLDLVGLARSMVEVRVRAGTSLKLETDVDVLPVQVEETAASSVINQLLQNAIEVSQDAEEVVVRVHRDGEWGCVDVIDRGPGMDEEFVREQLFRPLRTTKKAGYGIGMFQAREIMREQGGRLLVDSRPGRGTRMTMMFPIGAGVAGLASVKAS
ncbi:MAG: PEP-CTERM system histidine kinase PrsK [Alphaproteobacteria bacterium]|nr:PEP-CTERM system histidine kinase PrsK [Alphaproteobacteria bacterium]